VLLVIGQKPVFTKSGAAEVSSGDKVHVSYKTRPVIHPVLRKRETRLSSKRTNSQWNKTKILKVTLLPYVTRIAVSFHSIFSLPFPPFTPYIFPPSSYLPFNSISLYLSHSLSRFPLLFILISFFHTFCVPSCSMPRVLSNSSSPFSPPTASRDYIESLGYKWRL